MKYRICYIVSAFFVIFIACTPSRNYLIKKNIPDNKGSDRIRVLIGKYDSEVRISSRTRLRITEKISGKVIFDSSNTTVVMPLSKVVTPLYVESWNSNISINDIPFRGSFEIHNIIGKLNIINLLAVDEYLLSVVPSEIPASWNMQALKAQAIAARTYTYYHIQTNKGNSLYDLDSSTKFQVYRGSSVENPSTTAAVMESSGEIISSNDELILSFFHSTCGGKTLSDKYVWGGKGHQYLEGKNCTFCKSSPEYKWSVDLPLLEIKKYLIKTYQSIGDIQNITFFRQNDITVKVKIKHKFGNIEMSGNDFRLLFPSKKLKSSYFTSEKTKNGLRIHGRGWGHGVGMCQWGAKGMAEKGSKYSEILKFYYSNIKIVKVDRKQNKNIAGLH